MKFTFKYNYKPGVRRAPPEILEREEKYPLLPLSFYGKNNTFESHNLEALVDSGASGILIPKHFGEFYSLYKGIEISLSGINGNTKGYMTRIGLRIGRGKRSYDFGIVDAVLSDSEEGGPILIGHQPLFNEFNVIFETYHGKFHLKHKDDP